MNNELKPGGRDKPTFDIPVEEEIIVNGGDGYMYEAVRTDKPLGDGQGGFIKDGKTYILENPTLDLR